MNAKRAASIVGVAQKTTLEDAYALELPGARSRWISALAVVVGLHALPVLVAAYWLAPISSHTSSEPAIFIDMAPPAAPPMPRSETPPGPQQVETPQPKVQREIVESPPVTESAVSLPTPEPSQETPPAPETTAPPARPLPPAERESAGQTTWQALLLGHLDRHKRYPVDAQRRRQQGVPWVRFVMDREGRVLSAQLERSSGFPSLDVEAVNLPKRAQPLSKPPEDVPGATLELVVPVEFFIR